MPQKRRFSSPSFQASRGSRTLVHDTVARTSGLRSRPAKESMHRLQQGLLRHFVHHQHPGRMPRNRYRRLRVLPVHQLDYRHNSRQCHQPQVSGFCFQQKLDGRLFHRQRARRGLENVRRNRQRDRLPLGRGEGLADSSRRVGRAPDRFVDAAVSSSAVILSACFARVAGMP